MKNADTPLEQLEAQFTPEKLDEAEGAKKRWDTVLSFLDRDILPQIREFANSVPQINDIEDHQLRTAEDGRYVLSAGSQARDFMEEQISHVKNYTSKATRGLSEKDATFVHSLAMQELNKAMRSLKSIARIARSRFNSLVESSQGHTVFPEESNEVEKAVTQAGKNRRTSVSLLLRRSSE